MPRWRPPIGRPIGSPPLDTHITWPWPPGPAVSYQSSGAASAPGGNTPRALYGAGADGHPEAPDRRPLGACPYRRQCAECSPSKFIDSLFQTVMGRRPWPTPPLRQLGTLLLHRHPEALLAQPMKTSTDEFQAAPPLQTSFPRLAPASNNQNKPFSPQPQRPVGKKGQI